MKIWWLLMIIDNAQGEWIGIPQQTSASTSHPIFPGTVQTPKRLGDFNQQMRLFNQQQFRSKREELV